jgi:hypothetical protein
MVSLVGNAVNKHFFASGIYLAIAGAILFLIFTL